MPPLQVVQSPAVETTQNLLVCPVGILVDPSCASADQQCEASSGEKSWCFGDRLHTKHRGIHCHACSNAGDFPIDDCASAKTDDPFTTIGKFDTDSFAVSEHGSNPRGLKPAHGWSAGSKGQLGTLKSHLAWNENWSHANPACGETQDLQHKQGPQKDMFCWKMILTSLVDGHR